MATHDLTVAPYRQANMGSNLQNRRGIVYRKFKGSELKTLKDGTTPADGDTFKIFKVPKGSLVPGGGSIVVDADDTSILMDIGYTDGTTTDSDCFETDRNLNTTGDVPSSDDSLYVPNVSTYTKDMYITMTLADIASNLDDDTEFFVYMYIDLINQEIDEQLTTPL